MENLLYSRTAVLTTCILGLFGLSGTAFAAEISAVASVDRDVITVGDVLTLTVEVRYDQDLAPRMPGADTPLGEFEVRDYRSEPPRASSDGKLAARSHFGLTVFSLGVVEIPSIEVSYASSDKSSEGSISTDPIEIKVVRTLTEESEDIQDIKPPLEIPRDWGPIMLAFLVGVVIAAAGIYGYRARKRKTALSQEGPGIPDRPPHELAYEALERLKRSDLLVRGEIPRFHILSSEIIRRYVEGRFRVDALEMATDEVLDGLQQEGVDQKIVSLIEGFLSQCDLVKFAKSRPSEARSLELLKLGFQIVDETSPPRVKAAEDKPQETERSLQEESGREAASKTASEGQ